MALFLALPSPIGAAEAAPTPAAPTPAAPASEASPAPSVADVAAVTSATPAAAGAPSSFGDILRALELPRFPGELRRKVFPAEDVDAVLLAGRAAGWPAAEMRELLESSANLAMTHGGIQQWGQAVCARIAKGERADQILRVFAAELKSAATPR